MSEDTNQNVQRTMAESYAMYFSLPLLESKSIDSIYHLKTAFKAWTITEHIGLVPKNIPDKERTIRKAICMTSFGIVHFYQDEFNKDAFKSVLQDLPGLDNDLKKRVLFFFRNYANVLHDLKSPLADYIFLTVARTAIINNVANTYDYLYYIRHVHTTPEVNERLINDLIHQARLDISMEMKYLHKLENVAKICQNVLDCVKNWPETTYSIVKAEFNPENIMMEKDYTGNFKSICPEIDHAKMTALEQQVTEYEKLYGDYRNFHEDNVWLKGENERLKQENANLERDNRVLKAALKNAKNEAATMKSGLFSVGVKKYKKYIKNIVTNTIKDIRCK